MKMAAVLNFIIVVALAGSLAAFNSTAPFALGDDTWSQ